MQYDIHVFEVSGQTVVLGATEAGHNWIASGQLAAIDDGRSFLAFLEAIPGELAVGVLDPSGQMLNFRSRVLH